MSQSLPPRSESDGAFIIEQYADDPVAYVREVLRVEPDTWQEEILRDLLVHNKIAVASGHGIGKTALMAWIIHWFMATHPDPEIVVTANTKNQLDTKTWRELAKWNRRAINGHWFKHTATSFSLIGAEDTWFASAIPWSENNAQAFAGTHEKHVLILFDEASTISQSIFEVTSGALTSAGAKWICFGNPSENTGGFYECFHKFRARWHCKHVDARTAKMADQKYLKELEEDWGEDSDYFRVRVRGEFPRAGSSQFIPSAVVDACRAYFAQGWQRLPKVLGVDVARFGDDASVLCKRQGRKVHPLIRFRGLDTMQVAAQVVKVIVEWRPDIVVVDGVGLGAGVVDRLRQLGYGDLVIENNGGTVPDDPAVYFNKRAEQWGVMREALKEGVEIPDDRDLCTDLTGPLYGFTGKQQIKLERKEDMKKRGLASPDSADALALTYSVKPRKRALEEHCEEFEVFDPEVGY